MFVVKLVCMFCGGYIYMVFWVVVFILLFMCCNMRSRDVVFLGVFNKVIWEFESFIDVYLWYKVVVIISLVFIYLLVKLYWFFFVYCSFWYGNVVNLIIMIINKCFNEKIVLVDYCFYC